jgi:hypothetical protein
VTPGDAIEILESHLSTLARAAERPDPLVVEAVERLQPWRQVPVGRVTSELFISPRQLRRRFGAALGIGPTIVSPGSTRAAAACRRGPTTRTRPLPTALAISTQPFGTVRWSYAAP